MIKRFIYSVNEWVTRQIIYTGDDDEILLRKKIWLFIITLFIFFSICDYLSSLVAREYKIATIDILMFSLSSTLLIIFYFHRKNINLYGLLLQFMLVTLPSIKTYLCGGIFHTTGIEVVGLIGPIYALTFPYYRRAVLIFLYYIFLILGGTFIYEYLNPQSGIFPGRYFNMGIIRFVTAVSIIFLISLIYNLQIARLKRKEEERLKQLHTAKSKFYTNITHEFRTPLTIILGIADTIRDKTKNIVNHEVRMIKNNGTKLLRLINQLLNLSKMEANVFQVSLIKSDILPYLKYIMESFHSMAVKKNIRLHFYSKPDSVIMDYDPGIIEEIFNNLLSNAIKFTPYDGDVYIQIEKESDKGNDASGNLIIHVRDNGVGIAEDKLPLIFERFYKIDDENTRRSEGTGIGLALVKEYLMLIKGTVQVKSKPNQGTEFILSLPVTKNAPLQQISNEDIIEKVVLDADEEREIQPEYEILKNSSDALPMVLLVEDNRDVVEYLVSILTSMYQIIVAFNGNEGIYKALENVPDIIICDIMMPEKDGFEVCRVLKDDFRTNHIPIILLTAKADMDSKIGGLECGADAYIIKPFNKKELLVRIDKLIESRHKLKDKYSEMIYAASKAGKPKGLNEMFLQKITETLEKNYHSENYNIFKLCLDMGISRAQLHRKLIALTGKSTSDLIRHYRINKAKELLLDSDLTIAEIAYQVGFKDPKYFSKSFVKENGLTPRHFRLKNHTMKH